MEYLSKRAEYFLLAQRAKGSVANSIQILINNSAFKIGHGIFVEESRIFFGPAGQRVGSK